MTDQFAPWITDPDDPADIPVNTKSTAELFAAFAAMFPDIVLKPKSKGLKILGANLAEWASRLSDADAHRIETAIRAGLFGGLENTEVARQVVGSQRLAGVDGVTEITRRHIAHLGRQTLKRRK